MTSVKHELALTTGLSLRHRWTTVHLQYDRLFVPDQTRPMWL